MGKYINQDSNGSQLSAKGKAEALINDGAEVTGASFKENLIAILDIGMFEAAEFNYFKENVNVVKWLVHPKARELTQ